MNRIDDISFQRKIRYAQIICTPQYGFYINFDKKSFYEKNVFQIPEGSELYSSDHYFGELLKIIHHGKITLMAFVLDRDLLPMME